MKLIDPHKRISTPGDNETIATECLADEDRITPNDLDLADTSNLRKFDAKYVIGMLTEDLFSEGGKQTLFEYWPFSLAADDHTHKESDGEGNEDSEENRSYSQGEGKSTDDCMNDAG